jgi:hypothetical protein
MGTIADESFVGAAPQHPSYTDLAPANWSLIPQHMIGGLRRYIEDGIEPGSFLSAVLRNDLRRAVEQADATNIDRLPDYIRFLYNYAPTGSWGSPDEFDEWIGHKGLRSMGWTGDPCYD